MTSYVDCWHKHRFCHLISAIKTMDHSESSFANIHELLKSSIFLKQQLRGEETRRRSNTANSQSSSVYKRLSGTRWRPLHKLSPFSVNAISSHVSLSTFQHTYKQRWIYRSSIFRAQSERLHHAWRIWWAPQHGAPHTILAENRAAAAQLRAFNDLTPPCTEQHHFNRFT